ncbi:MAG: hypothetical protein RLZZ175_2882 [Bacteroidota bacterium]|jgi:hypothetical protein
MYRRIVYILFVVVGLISCNDRDKIINIDLPPYQTQTVVECYLDSGQTNKLLITKSASFQDTLYPVVTDAFITISNNTNTDTILYKPLIDTTYLKIYSHQGNLINNIKQGDINSLYIKLSNGQEIKGTTIRPAKVKIDTLYYSLSADQKKYNLTVKFKDNQLERNFYRAIFNVNGVIYNSKNIDYLFDDNNLKSSSAAVITGFKFDPKDTVIVTFYNLSEEYYRYLRSVRLADNANGNPFAQPASIKSNISGGIGIFTNLVYQRDTIYLPK